MSKERMKEPITNPYEALLYLAADNLTLEEYEKFISSERSAGRLTIEPPPHFLAQPTVSSNFASGVTEVLEPQ